MGASVGVSQPPSPPPPLPTPLTDAANGEPSWLKSLNGCDVSNLAIIEVNI